VKLNSIINRYVLREMAMPFVISCLFFTFVFLMAGLLDITNMIVNFGINILTVAILLLYSLPRFLEFVIPISIMVAVLVTFLRLTGDNEIAAAKACGISIYSLVLPVLCFCLMGFVITCLITVYGVPFGKVSLKKLTYDIAASHLDAGIKERTFNDSFKDVMLYINKIDLKNKVLVDVFIEDQRDKNTLSTVVSPKGQLFSDPETLSFHLRLHNGTINQVNIDRKSINSIHFDTYDIRLDLPGAASMENGRSKSEDEMSLAELSEYLNTAPEKNGKYYAGLIEFHKKFSIPFACFAFGLIAMPLGINTNDSKRSMGIGLSLFFVFLYYLLLSAGFVFGEAGVYPPVIGMWVPNMLILAIGVFFIIRTSSGSAIFSCGCFNRLKKCLRIVRNPE
jgi:lipopolysaccharide export system permease protein